MNINIDIYLRGAFQELAAFSIPDIGTFRKISRGSWVDEDGLHLHPPGTDIEFSTSVDPSILLADYFSQKIGLEEEVAEQISTQIRQVILHEIHQKGKFEIAEIGLLKKGQNDILTFDNYNHKLNALSDNYFGLSPISVSSPTNEYDTYPKNTDMKKSDRPESKKTFSIIGLKSSLLVALLFALGFLLLNQSPLIVHRSSLTQGLKVRFNAPESIEDRIAARKPVEKEIPTEIPDQVETDSKEIEHNNSLNESLLTEKKDKARNLPVNTPETRENESVPAIEDLLAEANTGSKPDPSLGNTRGQDNDGSAHLRKSQNNTVDYHLIVGSFKSLNSANSSVSKWKKQGYDAMILFPASGTSITHRVSVFASTDRSEVEEFATLLKAKGKKSTWIFEDRKQN